MRRSFVCLLLLAAALAGCATSSPGPSQPAPSVGITPSSEPATALPSSPTVPAQAIPTSPGPGPAAATASPPPAERAPLPGYLRSIDLGVPAGNSYVPRALAVHPGLQRLYARTHGPGYESAGNVTIVDLRTGQVERVVETGPDWYSEGDLVLDRERNHLYVVNPQARSAVVLDATSLEPLRTLEEVESLALDEQRGILYVAGGPAPEAAGDASVVAAVLRQLSVQADWEVMSETPLASGAGVLDLVLDPDAGRAYLVLNEASGPRLAVYEANGVGRPPGFSEVAGVALPGWPEGLLADRARGRLYLTANGGFADWLLILDQDGAVLEERELGDDSRRTPLALDPSRGRLFLGRDLSGNHGIEVVDLDTGQQIADYPLQLAPGWLLWDEVSQVLWVSQPYDHRIVALSGDTGEVRATVPTAVGLRDLNLDPGRSQVYLTDTMDRVHVLHSETDAELATLPGEGRISVDAVHGRFYTGRVGAPTVRVFDADALVEIGAISFPGVPVADPSSGGLYIVNQGIYLTDLTTLEVTGAIPDTLPQNPGSSPNPSAIDAVVDPGSGRLFAIIDNGVPGSNSGTYLYVYEPVSYEKVLEDTERSPWFIEVDAASGRAWVSRSHMYGRSTSLLVDGREYRARLESVYGALRFDPGLRRVYLSVQAEVEGHLLVLDADTLSVEARVPIGVGLMLKALDPVRHWLYLAREDGKIEIWSALGGERPAVDEPVPADLGQAEPSRLLLPPGDDPLYAFDRGAWLYRSSDGGQSWVRLRGGLPAAWLTSAVFSPGWAADRTLFAAVSLGYQGLGVWRSLDGGDSFEFMAYGLTDLGVDGLAISPDYVRDRTLFAGSHRGGLHRSTDGGQSWKHIAGGGEWPGAGPSSPQQVLFSPTYAQDHTLFAFDGVWWRSDDAGDTWQAFTNVGDTGYSIDLLIVAPDYASSRVLYYLLIPLESGAETRLFASSDGGESWPEVQPGPTPQRLGEGRLVVAPQNVAYLFWTPFEWGQPVELYRSSSFAPVAGRPAKIEWQRYAGAPFEAATPLDLSSDGLDLLALDQRGELRRWRIAELEWEPVLKASPNP